MMGRSHRAAPSTWGHVLLGLVMTCVWMGFSTALIVMNKRLYMLGFTYPFFVTGMGQVFSAIGGLVLAKVGGAPIRPCPEARVWVFKLVPVIVSTSATMFWGNASYLTLSVAFIQILKAFTPALTLVLCVGAGLEPGSWPLATSVLLIAGGTAVAVLVESGSTSFHVGGFLQFLASSVTEALRVVGAEVLLGASRYNSAEALVYIGGPTSAVLLACSALWEGRMWAPGGAGWLLWVRPWDFLAAFLLSFLVNLTCFYAIQYTSSLTFKVAGCVKNVAVVWYGVAAHGEHVTAQQLLGYLLSLTGFAMYSWLKSAGPGGRRVASSRRRHSGDTHQIGGPAVHTAQAKPHAM